MIFNEQFFFKKIMLLSNRFLFKFYWILKIISKTIFSFILYLTSGCETGKKKRSEKWIKTNPVCYFCQLILNLQLRARWHGGSKAEKDVEFHQDMGREWWVGLIILKKPIFITRLSCYHFLFSLKNYNKKYNSRFENQLSIYYKIFLSNKFLSLKFLKIENYFLEELAKCSSQVSKVLSQNLSKHKSKVNNTAFGHSV